jgi:hypothetical protein
MTKVEAIKKVLEDNGGIATWEIIYNEIENYYPDAKKPKEWSAGIRGVLYREIKNNKNFKKIDEGVFAIEEYDENKLVLSPKNLITTKNVLSAIRIGQIFLEEKFYIHSKNVLLRGLMTLEY